MGRRDSHTQLAQQLTWEGQGQRRESLRRVSMDRRLSQGSIRSIKSTRSTRQLGPTLRSRLKACPGEFVRRLAESPIFSAVTTVLTIYALFGDDIRLGLTNKSADGIFDAITIACMVVFGFEIFVCSFGKAGYLFGFFFGLDIVSTLTLLLDVTTISEYLFGDSISQEDGAGSTGDGGASDSAEAARAARMSRVGTKAGRVVRLIRLMRLIRLLRPFRGSGGTYYKQAMPGEDWDVGVHSDAQVEKESAVSKKLSEMTTRRVVMIVLTIMLCLPLFQPDVYVTDLDSSAQYGVNVLYRRLLDDLASFGLLTSQLRRGEYLASTKRRIYEEDFLMYVYSHNWFCSSDAVPDDKSSPLSTFAKLFWLGGSAAVGSTITDYFLPSHTTQDWDSRWNGAQWDYYQCDLPLQVQGLLEQSWQETTSCLSDQYQGLSLIQFHEQGVVCPDDLRWQEREVVYPTSFTREERLQFVSMFVFDRRAGSQMEAALNTAQTFFICLLLGVGAMTFSNDANHLVLMPIERMIAKLDKIRRNPLEAMTIDDEDRHREQVKRHRQKPFLSQSQHRALDQELSSWRYRLKAKLAWLRASLGLDYKPHVKVPLPMETTVLEKTIIKVGSLLALGFGEAGAEIIGQNMKGSESAAINAMIPGRRVEALFGFCDIRNFSDATEVLQDQVMVFVNRVAGVVHSCVNEFYGCPNMSYTDSFMMVWRLSGHEPHKQRRLADMAVICFCKVIGHVNTSTLLCQYRTHPRLVKRLPNYRVRMGFGLHSGWAIEGAIGSEFKIDATYLSPNVNTAARLEALAPSYGCLMLLSDAVVDLCSEEIAEECRRIDHISLAGGAPLKLYCMDLDDLALEVHDEDQASPGVSFFKERSKGREAKFRARFMRKRMKDMRWQDDFNTHAFFDRDPDIEHMRERFTVEFFCRFNMAYLNYEAGNWSVAKSMLEATRFLLATEDGPSAALLRYMRENADTCPKGWPGYRVINDR